MKFKATFYVLLELLMVLGTGVVFLLSRWKPGSGRTQEMVVSLGALLVVAGPVLLWRSHRWMESQESKERGLNRIMTYQHRPALITVGIFILGMVITVAVLFSIQRDIYSDAKEHYHRYTDRIDQEVRRRLNLFTYGLHGVRGLFAASDRVTRNEFIRYYQSRNVMQEFTGALGVGYIERVKRERLGWFIAREQADEMPEFKLKTAGDADELYVIKFIEPLERNRAACGYDIGSEATRRAAAYESMRSGQATFTGKIELVQDANRRPGLLYLLPVYAAGMPLDTPEAREQACVGWVYNPIVIEDVLMGVAKEADDYVDVELFDTSQTKTTTLLYDDDDHLKNAKGDISHKQYEGRMFSSMVLMHLGGREWTLRLSSTKKFDEDVDFTRAYAAGSVGILLSLLISGMVWHLTTTQKKALSLAKSMTEDLQQATLTATASLREVAAMRTGLDQHSILSVADHQGRIIDVNTGFCKISGYRREELIGEDHRLLNSGIHPREFWVEMWKTVANGKAWRGEVCNRRKDGSVYWVDSTIVPFVGELGKIEKYVSIRFDITAQKKAQEERQEAERKLRESERRSRAILEGTEVVAWEYDFESHCFTYVSPQAVKMGYPLEEWLKPNFWAEHIHPEDQGFACLFCTTETQAGRNHRLQYRMIKADGSSIWVDDVVCVEMDTEGRRILRGVLIDVTQARQLREAAETASRAKSEFLANMSHEIRTPLTAILGYTEFLGETEASKLPEQRKEAINVIRRAGDHLLCVVNDILDISKIEAGKMTVEQVETDLPKLLQSVETLIKPRAMGKGVEMELKLESAIPETVLTDPTRLRQILMNLAGNAVKFTEEGKVTIRVGATARKDEKTLLQFDVEDTGSGMPQEQATKIFKAFSQADSSVTRKYGGTGLGLVICQRLANMMGGNVVLTQTKVGVGSTFTATVSVTPAAGTRMIDRLKGVEQTSAAGGMEMIHPMMAGGEMIMESFPHVDVEKTSPLGTGAKTHQATTEGQTEKKGEGEKQTSRILLAEDGPDNRLLIAWCLKKMGVEVDVAENGRIALEMIETEAAKGQGYGLLVTDMQMPEMDGYTLAKKLRERKNAIAIVALTAHAMNEDRKRCMDAGCNDYASKPINQEVLLATCRKWLNKPGIMDQAA